MATINKRTRIGSMGIILLALFFSSYGYAQVPDSFRAKGPEIKVFHSKILNEERRIIIQVPSKVNKYDTYPVLYLLDGEAHAVMVGGQVQYLSESYKIIPNLIIIAIENTDRTRDLTPSHAIVDVNGKPDTSASAFGQNSGGGEKFVQFIRQELMPYVEENYPTAPYKILSGHSLGGLIAVYCMLHHPDYFNAYIAVSPSLQWDNKNLLQEASQQLNHFNVKNRRLFFCDANEDASFHQNQVELDSLLKKILPAKILYKRMFYPEESHVSEPVKAFYDGLRFIYPNWHLPYNSSAFKKTMNAKMIKDHFTELSNIYGYKVVPLHDEIIQISRFLRNDPVRTKDAIELLEMNASNYPSSAITQLTLGDTWMKAGNKAKAKDAYQLAVTLDPGNSQILQKIKNVSE